MGGGPIATDQLVQEQMDEGDTCAAGDGGADCWQRNIRSHLDERSHSVPLRFFKLLILGRYLLFDGLMLLTRAVRPTYPRSLRKIAMTSILLPALRLPQRRDQLLSFVPVAILLDQATVLQGSHLQQS